MFLLSSESLTGRGNDVYDCRRVLTNNNSARENCPEGQMQGVFRWLVSNYAPGTCVIRRTGPHIPHSCVPHHVVQPT